MASTLAFSIAASILLQPVVGTNTGTVHCADATYQPGSVYFSDQCYNDIQSCITKLAANASVVDCNGANISMQQQANTGAVGSAQNSDISVSFKSMVDLCLLSGSTSGTWGWSDNQWYWLWTGGSCYSSSGGSDTMPTRPAPYCLQDRDSSLPDCYPQPSPGGGPLKVLKTAKTTNGFTSSARGWNTYGAQALTNGSTLIPSFAGQSGLYYTQKFVETQCGVLANSKFKAAGFDMCSLDSGWQSFDEVDNNGRIIYNDTRFDMPKLGPWLHNQDLKLGLYITPGVPCQAANKTILGTDITVGSVFNGNFDQILCQFDYSKDGVQQWHDSVVDLWASWGVDMIKLDYITPGSPQNGAMLGCQNSDAVVAYQKAIAKTGKDIRLNISWKLCRNETWLPVWNGLAESMRTDQDINNYGHETFLAWSVAQRAIDNYRQYIGLQAQQNKPITIYPDMDNLFAANAERLTGVNDSMRTTVMNHWLGAGANLILGNDLTQTDDLGYKLLTSSQSTAAANFFAKYPMQPRNPRTGNNLAQQLQAWIGGPSDNGKEAYVLIANYGPDQGSGGFGTHLYGRQAVTVSLAGLGLSCSGWKFTDVWSGNSTHVNNYYTAYLTEGESQLLHLTKG
ncbi:glycoside hydrolase family 27 protein [Trichoderma atroviride IMI 206040]|uniref:alpha-galactosidase n=1 Tax=Hypocrea atroviridis (strain ATCC 20476 / IMI 206040) TaxID=452589 RepID=G9P0V8_HYPAI|nr:glycoside hydrolase family 27 protein [Trichoderma atroviride IMI 206040]EHK42424.1 glycoside hydrolase family 27 protein [Trichoderma atroviride IMI 206040]